MKLLIVLIFFSFSFRSYSQASISESNKIATFCKVWGFLKYHYPSVAKGKYDWDVEFFDKLAIIEQLKTKEEINSFYYKWISGLGKLKKNSERTPPSNAILSNYDFVWLRDSNVFTTTVTELLLRTQNNTIAKNHYVKRKYLGLAAASYVNEKNYKDSIYPSAAMRLLTLARYWNIINYFYPYKYLTDTNWQDVITEFVPKFISANDTKSYHRNLLELFAMLNDSHTNFSPGLYTPLSKTPPFDHKIVNDKIVVLDAFDDSICKKHDIRFGDVILAINGRTVKNLIDYYSNYVSASNYAALCDQLTPVFLWSDMKDSAVISGERDGVAFEKVIPAYSNNLGYFELRAFRNETFSKSRSHNYNVQGKHIAYVDLAKIKSRKEIKKVLESIKNTDAVILDVRNYPSSAILHPITNFFCTSRKPYAKFAKQSIKYPGALIWSKTLYCGKNNGGKYRGRLAVLIDESTISLPELFTMALKTVPGVALVGGHTAGADGGNHVFLLPGLIPTNFSNEAVYYPDGSETQRKGIVPDVIVLPTIEGVRLKRDEVLEKAIEILSRK